MKEKLIKIEKIRDPDKDGGITLILVTRGSRESSGRRVGSVLTSDVTRGFS